MGAGTIHNALIGRAAPMAAILAAMESDVRYLPAKPQKRPNGSWFIRLSVESPGPKGMETTRRIFDLTARTKPEAVIESERLKQTLSLRAPMAIAQMAAGQLLDAFETRHISKIGAAGLKYKSLIKNHLRIWEGIQIGQLRPLFLQDWLDGRSVSHETRKDLACLTRLVFDKADEWGFLGESKSPARHLSAGQGVPKYDRRKLSTEETRAVLGHLPEDVRLVCEIALYGVMRVSEVFGVRESDIDTAGECIVIGQSLYRGATTAGGKTKNAVREVPLGLLWPKVKALLKGIESNLVFGVQTARVFNGEFRITRDDREVYRQWLKPAMKAAGVWQEGMGFRQFRREAVTQYRATLDRGQAQKLAGHADERIQDRYTLADRQAHKKAIVEFQRKVAGT